MKNLIITGPSGVGKGSVMKKLMNKYPDAFETSISCTTRKIRSGEVDGTHYYFLSAEEFKKKIENNEFLEYEQYVDNYYGTLKAVEIARQKKVSRKDSLERQG